MSNSIYDFKLKVDIVDVIGSLVQLKKQGSNYWCCCPFHHEKTPSMCINANHQYFKCFSCDAKGDVIEFVKRYKSLDFKEACLFISNITGVNIDFNGKKLNTEPLDRALMIYKNAFTNSVAYKYAKKRGLSDESIDKFELGYGCIIQNHDPRFNFKAFNNRLIFPIYLPSGHRLAGFGARDISGKSNAKYINSPQSEFFNKQTLMYGFHLARDFIQKNQACYIVEGYLDVILAHQNGFSNVIAPLGTAINSEHFIRISKLTSNIILAFDKDNAGLRASFKAIEMCFNLELDSVKVLILHTKCKDLADFFTQEENAKEKFKNAKTINAFEFVCEILMNDFKNKELLEQNEVIKNLKSWLLKVKNNFLRSSYKEMIIKKYKLERSVLDDNNKTKTSENRALKGVKNIVEASILKSILEKNCELDFVKHYLNENDFIDYRDDFKALIQGLEPKNLYEILSIELQGFDVKAGILCKLKSKIRKENEYVISHKEPEIAMKELMENQAKIKEIESILNDFRQ